MPTHWAKLPGTCEACYGHYTVGDLIATDGSVSIHADQSECKIGVAWGAGPLPRSGQTTLREDTYRARPAEET